MLVTQSSILNNLHQVSVDERVKLFFEALSFTIRWIDDSYIELINILKSPNNSHDAVIRSAWTIIDNLYRLKCILGITPGLKKKEVWFQLTFRKLVNVENSRHFIEHYDRELQLLHTNIKPLVGHVGFVRMLDNKQFSTSIYVPGTIRKFKGLKIVNPAGLKMRSEIDHITLFLSDNEVDISDIYYQIKEFTMELEKHIKKSYTPKSI